jgi:erythronate-4-phosphate dehydrogenase
VHIIIDQAIPAASQLFGSLGDIQTIPGRAISSRHCRTAQAVIVRSVTSVNSDLLAGSAVQFIGSTTAGTDHIDQRWLQQQGIVFAHAPACNATAVVEYVMTALLWLVSRERCALREKTIGIVGVGHIGSLLNQRLLALGVTTLLCDPPRAERGESGPFWSLSHLVRRADVLTFHVPLQREGPHATWHLLDDDLLAALPDGRILINSARGAVFDNAALLTALAGGKACRVVLDVWEHEPVLSLPLLAHVTLATPHIAGYTLEGRVNGAFTVYQAICQQLGCQPRVDRATLLPTEQQTATLSGPWRPEQLKPLMDRTYQIARDDMALRAVADQTGGFDKLRAAYPERREWSSLLVVCDHAIAAQQWRQLGFQAVVR